MGDRVLVLFTDDMTKDYSPAIYMHNHGSEAPKLIRDAAPLLRKGDASYAAARFAGYCAMRILGPLGLGLIPPPAPGQPWDDYSHGNAGVYVVNMTTGDVRAYGGYGKSFAIRPDNFAQA